jgi:hypothetical protein
MAGGLAGAWLAHPPIAMWVGFVSVATQCVRIFQRRYSKTELLLDLTAIGTFFILAGYSFVSAHSISAQWWMPSVSVRDLLLQVRNAFPGNWQPLVRPVPLENLQVGYGLLAVFALSLAALIFWRREPLSMALAASTATLLALVVPIPLLTGALWHLAPQAVLVITNIWPIQRLALIIALCTVFGAALLMREVDPSRRLVGSLLGIILLAATAWSGFQASRLVIDANKSAPSYSDSKEMQRTENLVLSASAYGLRTDPPRYASMGVMDAELEHHFLDRVTGELLSSSIDAIEPDFGPGLKARDRRLAHTFTGKLDVNPGILDILPALKLEPHKKYLLALDFSNLDYTGILIIRGPEFFREYRLPLSGESRAFGSGPESSRAIPLWTSSDEAEEVQLQFVPTGKGRTPLDYVPFARFDLRRYDPSELPVSVESYLPYLATVRNDRPVHLETPRLYLPKYVATVDGAEVPVSESPDGFVMVPIEAGIHKVTLEYQPPLLVRLSYWVSIVGWLGLSITLTFGDRIFPTHVGAVRGLKKFAS